MYRYIAQLRSKSGSSVQLSLVRAFVNQMLEEASLLLKEFFRRTGFLQAAFV